MSKSEKSGIKRTEITDEFVLDHAVPVEEAESFVHIGFDDHYHPTGGYWFPTGEKWGEATGWMHRKSDIPRDELVQFPCDDRLPEIRGRDDLPDWVQNREVPDNEQFGWCHPPNQPSRNWDCCNWHDDGSDGTPRTRLNPNSALYWMEAAEVVAEEYEDVHVPETEVVEFDFMDALPLLDGQVPENFTYGELDAAACDLGWPVFIRTDLTSAKHAGLDGVQADDADDVDPITATLVEDCAMKSKRPAAFLVREWIDIESEFEAFGGLPIGVEFRVFATPDEHLCTHYYWPEDSIKQPSVHEPLWQDLRDELEHARQPPWMGAAACRAAFEADFLHDVDDPDRAWSVDFARDENGDWWLIDMALAADSWHPDCENKTELEVAQR